MRKLEAMQGRRRDEANVERLASAFRSAKAARKGLGVSAPPASSTGGAARRNKENMGSLTDDGGNERVLSPSRRSGGGGFGLLDANAYR